jgi:hypothetical protein
MKKSGLVPLERQAEINRKTTELAGAYPYIFSIVSWVCENHPQLVKQDTTNFYYQIGNETDPMPWNRFLNYGIGKYKDQKHLFLVELKKFIKENRPYWLPAMDGGAVLMPPFRITLKTKDLREISIAEMGRIKNTEVADSIICGVIIECYKPFFAGHFNGHEDGFIKQPAAWYAKIRQGAIGTIENKAQFSGMVEAGMENDMTALNVMRIWEYLALHDNGKGETKTVDAVDLLNHVAPSYLKKGEYIRHENLGSLLNAFTTLARITKEHRADLDFEIVNIELDQYDRAYAWNQGHRAESTAFVIEAIKHHLKAHENTLILRVKREGGRGHAGE